MKPVLIVLANEGFDPSEAAVPWQALTEAGMVVVFATPAGQPASADPLMVTGEGLDPWGWIPGVKRLKFVGMFLRANRQAREAYAAMTASAEFLNPISYATVEAENFSGLLLPGGHAKSIKPYLESEAIQKIASDFMVIPEGKNDHKPVAAICHGVLILARAQRDQRSLLHGRKVTALTWPLEKKAWQTARISRFWEPLYYRTYPELAGEAIGYRSTEAEIKRALARPEDFLDVSTSAPDYSKKTDGLHRDTPNNLAPAWVVEDRNLITARWPGDVNAFSQRFISALKRQPGNV